MRYACPLCKGDRTRRHDFRMFREIDLRGVHSKAYQRWFCLDCRKAFIPGLQERQTTSPYSAAIREKATILYVDTGGSYRAVTRELRRLGLSHIQSYQVWTWVQELGRKCVDPFEISRALKPKWSGWLEADGDRIRVGDEELSILLAIDVKTRDVPFAMLGKEDLYHWIQFFERLKALHYPFKGMTSDGDTAILMGARANFPGLLHHRCHAHFIRNVEELLPEPRYAAFPHLPTEYQRFQKALHNFLEAPDWRIAKEYLRLLIFYPSFQRPLFAPARKLVLQSLPQIIPAFFHKEMPRTSNLIENVIRFLDRRITPMDRFHSRESAWAMIKLLILYYRFHKFTNPSKKYFYIKGRSPLQLAGVNTIGLRWLSVGLQPAKNNNQSR
jgi:transposase-like protein